MGIDPNIGVAPPQFPITPAQKIARVLSAVTVKVEVVVKSIFKGMHALIADSDGLYFLVKLGGITVIAAQYVTKNFDRLLILGKVFSDSEEILELFGIVECVCEINRGEHKKDNLANRIARISLFAVNILGVFSLLDQVNLIDLGKIAQSIGTIRVFAFVAEISLSVVMQSGLIIYYASVGANAIIQLVKEDDPNKKIQAILDLTRCVAEVSMRIFILAGGTCVPIIIVLTTVSAGMGISALLHRKSIEQGS